MKTILVCTDFSKDAYGALHYASNLYKNTACHFLILHSYHGDFEAYPYPVVREGGFTEEIKAKQNSIDKGEELLHSIRRDNAFPAHTFEFTNTDVSLTDAIKYKLSSTKKDLVVLGNHGQSGLRQYLFGSTSIKVLKKIHQVPVLMVPQQIDFQTPKRIAFATDYMAKFHEAELEILKSCAYNFGAEIHIICVGREEDMSKKQWENYNLLNSMFDQEKHHFHWLQIEEENSKAIATHVREQDLDLLYMIKYKHESIKFFREPVIMQLDRHLRFPFLVVPSTKIKD